MSNSSLHVSLATALSFVCFALTCAAVFVPLWAYFEDDNSGFGSDRGYFGPWSICKELTYDRTRCGSSENISRFRRSRFVIASGVAIVISAITLGVHFVLSVFQMFSSTSRERSGIITTKLWMAVIGALSTFASVGMFAVQTDDVRRGFSVTKGIAFYMVAVGVILTIVLCIVSYYDYSRVRQPAGNENRGYRVGQSGHQMAEMKERRPFPT